MRRMENANMMTMLPTVCARDACERRWRARNVVKSVALPSRRTHQEEREIAVAKEMIHAEHKHEEGKVEEEGPAVAHQPPPNGPAPQPRGAAHGKARQRAGATVAAYALPVRLEEVEDLHFPSGRVLAAGSSC